MFSLKVTGVHELLESWVNFSILCRHENLFVEVSEDLHEDDWNFFGEDESLAKFSRVVVGGEKAVDNYTLVEEFLKGVEHWDWLVIDHHILGHKFHGRDHGFKIFDGLQNLGHGALVVWKFFFTL